MSGYDDGPVPDADAGRAGPTGPAAPRPPLPPPDTGQHPAQYPAQYPASWPGQAQAGQPAGPSPYPPQGAPLHAPYGPPAQPYGPPPQLHGPSPYPLQGASPYQPTPYQPTPYQPYGTTTSGVVPPYGDRPKQRGNGVVILATAVVWALVMVGIVVGVDALAGTGRPTASGDDPSDLVRIADAGELPEPITTARRMPSPGFEESAVRLSTVAPPTVPSDEYAFLDTYGDDDEPIGWSPCRPIHVAVNLDGAPAGFLDVLLDGLGELSRATGLVFVYDGPTTERPDLSRTSYLPERYGDRWAPVLVAWADEDELADFEGDVVGLALSETRSDRTTGAVVRISGEVYLDTELREYPDDPTGQEAWVSVLHHELGHLIGLDHVDESDQLMYPEDSGRLRSYQEGDLAGLHELGQGACAPGV